MSVTNYHTVNGQIMGSSTGATFTPYLTDALGSVTATVSGGSIKNTCFCASALAGLRLHLSCHPAYDST